MRDEQHRPPRRAPRRLLALALVLGALSLAAPAGALTLPGRGEGKTRAAAPAEDAVDGGRTLIPIGRAVGIKLFSDGVMVVGLADVDTGSGSQNPAKTCGLRESFMRTQVCLAVFHDRGLIHMEQTADHLRIQITDGGEKGDLERSELMKKLHRMAETTQA